MKRRVIDSIKFSDYDTRAKLITQAHTAAAVHADRVLALTGVREPVWDLQRALQQLDNKIRRYYHNTSKYKPHQGARECARRRGELK